MSELVYTAPVVLPHHDLDLLIRNEHLLDEGQREYLSVWQMRRTKSAYARNHADYNARASLILMSQFDNTHSFIWCGHREKKARSANGRPRLRMCKEMRLCPRCNYVFRVKPLFQKFGNESTFHKARALWFLTIAYTSNPENALRFLADDVEEYFGSTERTGVFDYTGKYTPAPLPIREVHDPDAEDLRKLYWNAGHEVISEFKDEGEFDGYCTADDLHVDFRGGGGFLPHDHAVVSAHPFSQRMVDDLGDRVQARVDAATPSIKLYASVKVYRITTLPQLRRLIRYVVKPVDFVSPYIHALASAEAQNPNGSFNAEYLEELNYLVDDFLEAMTSGVFYHRRGFRLGGDFFYRKGKIDYIGVPPVAKRTKKTSRASKGKELRLRAKEQKKIKDAVLSGAHEF